MYLTYTVNDLYLPTVTVCVLYRHADRYIFVLGPGNVDSFNETIMFLILQLGNQSTPVSTGLTLTILF